MKKRAFVYGLQEHDMHSLLGGYGDPTVRLSQAGVDVPKVDAERRKHGMCTLKMANIMKKFGFNPNLSFNAAGNVIATLKANDWKVPAALRADVRYQ